MQTWIVVAHRAGAKIFKARGPYADWELRQRLDHPAGRLQGREIDSDRPGRLFKFASSQRSAVSGTEAPEDHETEMFAREVAHAIEKGRSDGAFDKLILVAEPRFLGRLKQALSNQALKSVLVTVNKDLKGISDRELPRHLGNAMEAWQSAMLPTG